MTNSELIKEVLGRMSVPYSERDGNIVVRHTTSDWDLISTLADRLSLVVGRWMENQEPRTTIYLT